MNFYKNLLCSIICLILYSPHIRADQYVAPSTLSSGCIAGRYATGTGVAQCATMGTGIGLSSQGVIGTTLPANLPTSGIVAGGVVQSVNVTNNGTYTVTLPTCTMSAPATGGQQAVCAVANMSPIQGYVVAGGSGYAVNDLVYITSSNCSSPPVFRVNAIGSGGTLTGAVVSGQSYTTSVNLTNTSGGLCTAPAPTLTVATTTSGSGTGLTLDISWYILNNVTVSNGGSGYVTAPTVTFSTTTNPLPNAYSATGTSALVNILTVGSASTGVATLSPKLDGTPIRITLTGTAYTIPAGTDLVRFIQTSTIASQTVTLPTPLGDGQQLVMDNYSGTVTAMTYVPSIMGWVNGSTLPTNIGIRIRWDAADSTWHREF